MTRRLKFFQDQVDKSGVAIKAMPIGGEKNYTFDELEVSLLQAAGSRQLGDRVARCLTKPCTCPVQVRDPDCCVHALLLAGQA